MMAADRLRCNRCHRPMPGTTAYDGACACGGLIENAPADDGACPPPTPAEVVDAEIDQPVITAGRNDPCPCGSGLKYKKCCGRTS
jgi:hypothetical protein